jgi:8-oxo-dGTP pyrophosphatase MutT (NUDIX family)
VVIEQSHILLVHHRRIGAWLPPGGHIEEHELPHETAVRETKEETGIDICLVGADCIQPFPIDNENAFFLPTPLCIHAVKAHERKVDYYHIDLAYLCCPIVSADDKGASLPKIIADKEVYEARWVDLQNLSKLPLAKNVVEIVALAKSRLNLP